MIRTVRTRVIATAAIAATAFVPLVTAPGSVAATTAPATAASSTAASASPVAAAAQPADGIDFELAWERTFTGKGISLGSPGVGYLDDAGASVIVGSASGKIWALHTSTGSTLSGWPHSTGGIGVMSTPSVSGKGSKARVLLGIGAADRPTKGGFLALSRTGKTVWYRTPYLLPNKQGGTRGVMSSLAVGNLRTGRDVVGGAMGQMQLALGVKKGKALPGFPWLQADTNFSTPALADIYKKGRDYIIEGGDSTAGSSAMSSYISGGHIRILKPSGNLHEAWPSRGLVCEYTPNQVVQSSPAVGKILKGNKIGIVTGTGIYYHKRSDTNKIITINARCKKVWSKKLDGATRPSPALADIRGNGNLDVVTVSEKGTVYALNGANGHTIWTKKLKATTDGSITTFQAPGADFQYVLAPTQAGLYVLDGRTGDVVKHLSTFRLRSSATVTADPDGSIGITVAGSIRGSNGHWKPIVQHFRVVGSSVTTVQTKGAWPMFHHDPQLTGYAN